MSGGGASAHPAPDPAPFRVTHVEETASTNADLVAAARAGGPHGLVLVAEHQTAGRGRQGRTWSAPPGSGVLCSVLLRPGPSPVLAGAMWAVGLAACDACQEVAGVRPSLKWPNDLVVGDRKLAGVLAESVVESGSVDAVVVGIGLNVAWTDTPPADMSARAITLSEAAGRPVSRQLVLEAFLRALGPLEQMWREDPVALLDRYRARLSTLGRGVRVELVDGASFGVATDVTADGSLVVRGDDGVERTFHAGDVVHLRDHRSPGSPR